MSDGPVFISIRLHKFKVEKCPADCGKKNCFDFHNELDRKRNFVKNSYLKYSCPSLPDCENEECSYSHNLVEQIYHPDNFKRKYCLNVLNRRTCQFRELCAYAHSDLELKTVPLHLLRLDINFFLFHFKTAFCPFTQEHDKFVCVYAHNWQDFKRPYFPGLEPVLCQNWNKTQFLESYRQGCAAGTDCLRCHGWKELDYHPRNLKKLRCPKSRCGFQEICSFLHHGEAPYGVEQHKWFDVVPKAIHYGKHTTKNYVDSVSSLLNCSGSRLPSEASTASHLRSGCFQPSFDSEKLIGDSPALCLSHSDQNLSKKALRTKQLANGSLACGAVTKANSLTFSASWEGQNTKALKRLLSEHD